MVLALLAAVASSFCFSRSAHGQSPQPSSQIPQADPARSSSSKPPAAPRPLPESAELQQALDTAGNDRAALVRNLEDFLKKYPESRQRPQIYRALVEASLQLRDNARATDYAERIVALAPDDMSMTLLAIQLLERNGDDAALHRAVSYSARVLAYVDSAAINEKSPKVSQQEWQTQQSNQRVNILELRGRLYRKLHDNADAKKDFAACMALLPTSQAAEQLGEIAELNKDLQAAVQSYAEAFVLSGGTQDLNHRRELRQKLGNAWRLSHGSDAGLGDFLLHAYDDSIAAQSPQPQRNAAAKEPYDFGLRNVRDGSLYSLAAQKGKILVVNFWATWCGPCREMEPHFERVAAQFQNLPDVVFLAADCDEDESLVPAYLQQVRPRTTVVFADGLDRLLAVNSLPTIIVLDRAGKIAYRADGFDPDTVEAELISALRRVLSGDPPNSGDAAHGVKSGL